MSFPYTPIVIDHTQVLLSNQTIEAREKQVPGANKETRVMATHRQDDEMKRKCNEAAAKTSDPLEKLRLKCLARGASGIKGLGRYG